MPSQNWYFQNNLRSAVQAEDYVLLGNLIAGDPGGPEDTAAAALTDFVMQGPAIETDDDLLGFFGAPPVDQPDAVADATGTGDVVPQLNALLARMRELGLIAT